MLPEGRSPLDVVEVPAAARDVRRFLLQGHERVQWRIHVAGGYTIDFTVKVCGRCDGEHVISKPERGVEFDGHMDLGGEHADVSSAFSSGVVGDLILELDFDNSFSYFTGKRIDFQLWKTGGVARSVTSYNEAIEECVPKGEWSRAACLRERMQEVGVQLDAGSYRALLRVGAAARLWKESLKLLDEMKAADIPPDSKCYASAISACEGSGEAQKALELMDEMEHVGAEPKEAAAGSATSTHASDRDRVDWLRWALNEACRQCPEGALELRCHLNAAVASLEKYAAQAATGEAILT